MADSTFYDYAINMMNASSSGASLQNVGMNNALAQQQMQNPYHHAATTYSGLIGGVFTGTELPSPPIQRKRKTCDECGAGEAEVHKAECEYWKDRCACHAGKASKVHRFVELLRMELDAWHGNALERFSLGQPG